MIYTPLQLHRYLRQRLYINGTEYVLDGQASVSRDINDFQATCNVTLRDVPDVSIAFTSFDLDMQWYGTWHRVFTGVALPRSAKIPVQYTVEATDILYLLDTFPATEIEWSNRSYLDAVQDLLTAAGVPSSRVSLPSATTLTARDTLGVVQPIIIKTSDNIKSTMRKLMEFGQYRLYCDRNGIVRLRKFSTVPTNTADNQFSTDSPADDVYGIFTPDNEIGKDEAIVNRYRVEGRLENVRDQPFAVWSTTAVSGLTDSTTSDYCQNEAQCAELATELGQSACRTELLWNIRMPPDPTLEPSVCIELQSSDVGIDTFTPGRIIRQRFDGVDMELTVSYNPRAIGGLDDGGDGLEDDGYDPLGNPIAAFDVMVEQEGSEYGLVLDATASNSDTSSIASYSWGITGVGGGYPKPALSSAAQQTVVVDTYNGVTITLTVTDDNGLTDETSITLDDTTEVYTRYLQSVVDNRWYVCLDWSVGWVDITPSGKSVTACVHRSDTQYFFAGMSDGGVWRYDVENSANDPVQVFAGNGTAVSVMDQGETFASVESGNTVVFATGASIFVSRNALGVSPTWTEAVLPATVNEVQVNAYTPNVITVAYGSNYAVSFDSGASFEVFASSTGDCVGFTAFPWDQNWAAIFDATSDDGKLLPYGGDVDWDTVAGLTPVNITPGLTEELLYITDADDNFIVVQDNAATVPALAGGSLSDIAHIERDGAINDIVWLADSGVGAGKIVAKEQIISLGLTGTGQDIGYGILKSNKSVPPIPVVTTVYYPSSAGVWQYTPTGGWTLQTTGLPTGVTWLSIEADNQDANKLLLMGTVSYGGRGDFLYAGSGYIQLDNAGTGSAYYYTTDGGDNWYELRLATSHTGTVRNPVYGKPFLHKGLAYAVGDGGNNYYVWIGTPSPVYSDPPTNSIIDYYEIPAENRYARSTHSVQTFVRGKENDDGYAQLIAACRGNGGVGYINFNGTSTSQAFTAAKSPANPGYDRYQTLAHINGTEAVIVYVIDAWRKYDPNYTNTGSTLSNLSFPQTSEGGLHPKCVDVNERIYGVSDLNSTNPVYIRSKTDDDLGSYTGLSGTKRVLASNVQDSTYRQYVVVGNVSGDIAIYDTNTDEWVNVAKDGAMASMSNYAITIVK